MREKNTLIIICGIICATLIMFGALFWPTLYLYSNMSDGKKTISVRINRITGTTEIFGELGWKMVGDICTPLLLPPEERAKLVRERGMFDDELEKLFVKSPLPEGSYVDVPHEDRFALKSTLYNGSNWIINKIIIVIECKDKDGKTIWKRKYQANIIGGFIKPFSSFSFTIEPSDANGAFAYIWFIDEAYGYKSK